MQALHANFVGKFPNIAELEKYATNTQDAELLGKIRIVKTFGHSLPRYIDQIKQKTISITEHAGICLLYIFKFQVLFELIF